MDLRFGLRMLLKTPAFTAVAVLLAVAALITNNVKPLSAPRE